MSDNASHSGSGGGAGLGVIAGVLLAIVLIGAAVFAFNSGLFSSGSTHRSLDVNLNVHAPSAPSLPSAPSVPSTPAPQQ